MLESIFTYPTTDSSLIVTKLETYHVHDRFYVTGRLAGQLPDEEVDELGCLDPQFILPLLCLTGYVGQELFKNVAD